MANHKSAQKRIRQTAVRRLRNRLHAKTMRNAMKSFFSLSDKEEATKDLPRVKSLIDRLAKRNIIHKNKAANLKSKVQIHVNSL